MHLQTQEKQEEIQSEINKTIDNKLGVLQCQLTEMQDMVETLILNHKTSTKQSSFLNETFDIYNEILPRPMEAIVPSPIPALDSQMTEALFAVKSFTQSQSDNNSYEENHSIEQETLSMSQYMRNIRNSKRLCANQNQINQLSKKKKK
jgi:hypothetical protein